MKRRIKELPTHVVIDGERYSLEDDPTVAAHNAKCERDNVLKECILPVGKILKDATAADLLKSAKVIEVRAEVNIACAAVLRAFSEDQRVGTQKLYELYDKFELYPPLDASGLTN
jgi:hypothetical protein